MLLSKEKLFTHDQTKYGPLAYMFWESCESFHLHLVVFQIIFQHTLNLAIKSSGELHNFNGYLEKNRKNMELQSKKAHFP